MDSKCIFNLLLGGSFSPEKEWQHEAHWNQWEDFQAFQWPSINASREQIAHVFRGNYVNNSGPWIWFRDGLQQQVRAGNSKPTALATATMREGVSASVQQHSQPPAPLLVGTEPIQQDPHLTICFARKEELKDKLEAVQNISKDWNAEVSQLMPTGLLKCNEFWFSSDLPVAH